MSSSKGDVNYRSNKSTVKKADIIIGMDKQITSRLDVVNSEIRKNGQKIDTLLSRSASQTNVVAPMLSSDSALREEFEAVKREVKYIAAQNEQIFLELSGMIQALASQIGNQTLVQNVQPVQPPVQTTEYTSHVYNTTPVTVEINYDKLAKKVAEILPIQEVISPDYIASKVAEQLVFPDYAAPAEVDIDYDKLAARVAELLPSQELISPDYIASKVAEQIVIPENNVHVQTAPSAVQYIPAASSTNVELQLDEDELADRIALKVGNIKAEDFDILVDDDGCSSISEVIVEKLNYDIISSAIAEKLRTAIEYIANREPDYDEMANRISEKIEVAGVNEDSVAEKTAAILSEHLPEVDNDDIADKVVSQILQSQENTDYDIVLDEEGINKITEQVTEEVNKANDSRFAALNDELQEIKEIIASGVVVRSETPVDDSSIVRVSEVVEEEPEEEVESEDDDISELVDEIDEMPADGEILDEDLDGLDGLDGGVDFRNMMKYNRSFIARIIQSTDDQKEYYGRVKTALLAYKRVNSSIAWGAERFNLGRETIARFKIRGKTLCLYLALDPNAYPYSVYHQVDVSDNKSMHGTPMMVKIKSDRGAKKAIRLIDDMLEQMEANKRNIVVERDYAAMYPYERMSQLIKDGLVKDMTKGKR